MSGGMRIDCEDDSSLANAFSRLHPALSARAGLTGAQLAFIGVAAGTLTICAALLPVATGLMLGAVGALAFTALLAVRVYAISVVIRGAEPPSALASSDAPDVTGPTAPSLPFYTVLVTLYREASIVPHLIEALDALEYPRDRLEVMFLLETDDFATRRALERARLSGHMQIVVVPDGLPRTKPRALCFGLARCRGEYVVVYDAEDRPEPGQLLEAVSAFQRAGPQLGCLQARLNVYNPGQSFITGQFAVEYTALFDGILPALARAGAPVPLGGTSNHFPKAVLETVGGWDPWNVTEDADLGLRLARFGLQVKALRSTTWEEAPPTFGVWFRQRTRWQKGWMQTYMVHMRDPVALWKDLGTARFLWFQVILGGGLLAAAAHPWFVAGLVSGLITVQSSNRLSPAAQPGVDLGGISDVMWWTGFASLAGAATAAVALSLITIFRRRFIGLNVQAVVCPLIWLPVSLAAYCALIELVRRPFHWAKTPHGGAPLERRGQCPASHVAPDGS